MAKPVLHIDHLTLATDTGTIVSNLSFHIDQGEIVALTGKSGSGKTSIAAAILDLLPPEIKLVSGQIKWDGRTPMLLPDDHQQWSILRGREIGFTQQDVFGAFNPVLKMGHQMIAIIQERILREQPNIALELHVKMEEVGLHDIDRLLDSYPHELSGGQLQRCQLAMVIVIRPELLIVDEPTSAVDKINQAELLYVFRMIREKYNLSILCITHEEDVVRQIASREIQLTPLNVETIKELIEPAVKIENVTDHPVVLEIKGVKYSHAFGGIMYKKGATIGEIFLNIHRGSSVGVVGESGSGKSTLAYLLVGLYPPLSGQVVLDGHAIDFQKSKDIQLLRSKVQLVMQDGRGSLHPHLTIKEILLEVGPWRRNPKAAIHARLKESMTEVGLSEDLLERTPGQLSGGECLRVSIARALLVNPIVLICDESTASLDSVTTAGILKLLSQLKTNKQLALIFISHDQKVIRQMAEYIVVLAEGKVIEKGMAVDILKRPTHQVTKRIFAPDATLYE